ncbi:unnamed protein product [Trichogramma brassicae]|uniref:Hedgehog protein n=1 Tax=Trichogramma brassicae TaxID=86971 RepID=A0A6H5IW11_9HYME|nr:unnamed protein product [Trichogramma brassicae]
MLHTGTRVDPTSAAASSRSGPRGKPYVRLYTHRQHAVRKTLKLGGPHSKTADRDQRSATIIKQQCCSNSSSRSDRMESVGFRGPGRYMHYKLTCACIRRCAASQMTNSDPCADLAVTGHSQECARKRRDTILNIENLLLLIVQIDFESECRNLREKPLRGSYSCAKISLRLVREHRLEHRNLEKRVQRERIFFFLPWIGERSSERKRVREREKKVTTESGVEEEGPRLATADLKAELPLLNLAYCTAAYLQRDYTFVFKQSHSKGLYTTYSWSSYIVEDDMLTFLTAMWRLNRCKEKLNTLAISVMNQWPGVKLRVTEGWDEEGKHATDSLHYEGRAVDVTTSDRDRAKYGMLARLAVEAGFDWVYYESRSHIHCSVKSESSSAGKSGGCFPGTSTALTADGRRVALAELQLGERVAALDSATNRLVFSEVIGFIDRAPAERRQFLRLRLGSGKQLKLTATHLVPVQGRGTVFAARVSPGDRLLVQSQKSSSSSSSSSNGASQALRWEEVLDVELVLEEGAYAPLTAEGTLLVDDVAASCYAVVDSQSLAHACFLPLRLWAPAEPRLREPRALPGTRAEPEEGHR